MPIGVATPRDKFDQLMAFVRRTLRYWWLVGLITFVGGVLAVVFALHQKPKYLSEAKVFYNERIQSSILQGRNVGQQTKNLGTQYSEMLMARSNIAKIVEEQKLFPDVVAKEGIDAAIEEFEKRAQFRVRGTGMFLITYLSENAEEAQRVTSQMVQILVSEDLRLRRESASATMNFLVEEKNKVNAELQKRERALAEFMNEHPEFAMDTAAGVGTTPGASIRAQVQGRNNPEAAITLPPNADPRLLPLERQRRRIKARLEAPDDGTGRPPPKTPEQIEAEQAVNEAQRELKNAQGDLDNALARFTPAHPDVIKAQRRVEDAQRKVDRAKAAVPPDAPRAAPLDRPALEAELRNLEREIASLRAAGSRKPESGEAGEPPKEGADKPANSAEDAENWIVVLETKFQQLSLAVREQRSRLEGLDTRLSDAEIMASQQMADQGAVLTIIDEPNLPTKPQGKGRMILVVAGTAVFVVLGMVLALALALVDDRIYRGGDLEVLALAPMVVVVPRQRKRGLRKKMVSRGG